MAKKHWIQGAIKHPGALKAKAAAEGKTVVEYCSEKHTGTTAKQCALAESLRSMNKGK